MKHMFLHINNIKLPIQIHSEKRKYARVSIGKKAIYIRLPLSMSEREKTKQISEMVEWARGKLEQHADRFSERPARRYKDGETLRVGDKTYRLSIICKDKKTSSAAMVRDTITLSISSRLSEKEKTRHISSLLSRCIGRERLPALCRKIMELNNRYFKLKVGTIRFKYQKSRWGSCSSKKNINISTRLLFAPDDVLEYVCIHELAHLKEPNHSPRFWSLVKKAVPDYKKKEKWLKENQHKCWF
jgi:predicted metal-dependent hydrolase